MGWSNPHTPGREILAPRRLILQRLISYEHGRLLAGYGSAHCAGQIKSPFSKILLSHLGGAISRVGADETAYIHRDAPFLLNINSMWTDPRESAEEIGWARDFWSAMQPFSAGGVYVNFLSNEG